MDSELLLKFTGYFPDNLSALSRTLLRFLWTTFVETAVYGNQAFRLLLELATFIKVTRVWFYKQCQGNLATVTRFVHSNLFTVDKLRYQLCPINQTFVSTLPPTQHRSTPPPPTPTPSFKYRDQLEVASVVH